MNINIDENELKKELAYKDTESLIYAMQCNIDFLESHNKNYNNKQYQAICELQSFIRYMQAAD